MEITVVEELVVVLGNFSTASTFLSYEEDVSMSAVFPILHSILDQLQPDELDSGVIKQFKEIVISERFELILHTHSYCHLLSALDLRILS